MNSIIIFQIFKVSSLVLKIPPFLFACNMCHRDIRLSFEGQTCCEIHLHHWRPWTHKEWKCSEALNWSFIPFCYAPRTWNIWIWRPPPIFPQEKEMAPCTHTVPCLNLCFCLDACEAFRLVFGNSSTRSIYWNKTCKILARFFANIAQCVAEWMR